MDARKFFRILLIAWPVVQFAHADSLAAADALRQLIQKSTTASPSSPGAAAPGGEAGHASSSPRRQEHTQPNDTLDLVIKRTWPGLPTKEIWVRKTYVDLNPGAFVQGNPNLMLAGAVLTIPSQADLRASFSAAHPKVAALFEPLVGSAPPTADKDPSPMPAKWVRYP